MSKTMPLPSEKIIELAQKTGFEAELRIASILSSAGWKLRQNIYYIDKDEKKGRELDLLAYRGFHSTDNEPETTCYIHLCIEIKRTAEPFIFFSNQPTPWEVGQGHALLNWKHRVDRHVLSFEDIERDRPFNKLKRVARSYVSFKDGKGQQIQSGVLSAVKSAVHFTDECDETYSETSHDICFFMPVLIVDGPLYECYIDKESNELTSKEVSEIVYVQHYLSENYGSISNEVYILKNDIVESRILDFVAWGESILSAMRAKKHLFGKDE